MSRRGPPRDSGTHRRRAVQAMGPRAAAGQAEAQQLQELRSRTERAERRLLACETLVGELGSNLAALGSMLQDYGHLQQRLDNVENLLKNRNFWILRLPPSSRGEIPKVPVTFDDISVYFNEQEWERLDRWQKDLYRAVMRGNYETLISLDYAVSKPDILSRMERDEELCIKPGQEPPQTHIWDGQEPPRAPEEMDQVEEALGEDEVPMEADSDYAVSKPDILSRIKRDEELCIKPGQEPPQTHIGHGQEPPQRRVQDGLESPQAHTGDSQKPPQTGAPDGQVSLQTDVPDGVPQTGAPEGQKPPQTGAPDVQVSLQTDIPDGVPQTGAPDGQKPLQTGAPDDVPQTGAPEGEKPPQTGAPEGEKPPQTGAPDGQKPPQTGAPDGVPQTGAPEGQEPPQTGAPDGQKPPQTGAPDGVPQTGAPEGQKPPQTGTPDGQKPPQTPEDTNQKEESLREDKVPMEAATEFPIVVMNVMSLSVQKEKLHGEDQPETEMEEDPAECGTEDGFVMEDEVASEGASPEDIKVKKEEPEGLQEGSAPSPSPEIQKCPKSEQAKAKSKKKPSRCESSSLLMGNCRRGYVREWSHPCTECGKRFRLKINLIIHQRSHAKDGPYECSMCDISFADKRHLDVHQSIHIKDRAFGAKVWGNVHPELRIRPRGKLCGAFCGGTHGLGGGTYAGGAWLGQAKEEPDRGSLSSACYSRQQSPKSRTKSVVKCSFCKKTLSCSTSLQRHLQTHRQERPHCCATCKKCFTRRTHLLRHEKIHDRQKALAALQQPTAAQPRGAPEAPAGRSSPHPPAQAPEGNVSPVATAAPADMPLVGPAELGPPDKSRDDAGDGKGTQPVVRLGNKAAGVGVMEK
ncbi:zinc finger protein 783-like [Nyctibius grandis]|uniref:zinc finger protein 783-like n=1 Tax=Nyctibius grandis TaxID=48427 RepID=UPI0035BC712C